MEIHIMTLFHFFSLLILFSLYSYGAEDEVRSLLEFRKGIKSDPLGKVFDSWNQSLLLDPSACPSAFHGVVCDDNTGMVAAVALDRIGLVGDLKFSTLIGLKQLRNLSLSGNLFTGRLVPTLRLMTSLQHLDLSDNLFYGPVPAQLNDLWGLNYLNLSHNDFSGGFPGGIRNLQQLRVLDLHSNRLRGDVNELLSELRYVDYLDLSGNSFSGSLSMSSDNVSGFAATVQYVNLSHNLLGGGFLSSDSLELFMNLRVLDLANNSINGELPSFRSLPNLRVLRLGNNQLFGSIPQELLQGQVPLEELDLSGNGFSGSVQIINSTTLNALNLSSNELAGPLPSTLGSCVVVDMSKNNLSGELIDISNWGSSLEILDLSSNRLSGGIPNLTSQFQRLTFLSLRNNSLVGTLPTALGTYPRLITLDLSSNELYGLIPPTLFNSPTIGNLNLSVNNLTGPIPLGGSQAGELLVLPSYPHMEYLDLSYNSLTGSLLPDIANLGRLQLLNLANNHLSGQLPNELSKLEGLEYLDLSRNNFNGDIPGNLSATLKVLHLSYNNFSGTVPENLNNFPDESFHPGNVLLVFPLGRPSANHHVPEPDQGGSVHHRSKSSIKVAIIVASVAAAFMIAFVLLAYHQARRKDFHVRSQFRDQTSRDVRLGKVARPSLFKFHGSAEPPPTSLSFSNDHLLTSNSRSLSGPMESGNEILEQNLPEGKASSSRSVQPAFTENQSATSGRKSSPGSPIASSPRFIDTIEQSVTLDVYSPDRLAGELFLLDSSVAFTAEELSRAPAEVLGRSSHGTLYKAMLDSGLVLTVKWLRVGLVKTKKEFAKEVKKIASVRHPNVVSLRAYYCGPREQERLILADYIPGDSLALHLYETTPRRHSPLSFSQRLKVAVDVARCMAYLHERGLPHGNLKPTNILLTGSDYSACLTDYGLHRLMTAPGIAEQILNLGALGYRAPELANTAKPAPSFKADVYAFGVIIMELLTRRSAGDIISGQSGAVDLTDWVRLCDQEGRGMDCVDRDISGREEHLKAMEELLAMSLRCILPVNERPNIRQVFEDLCSISV